jgi:hypothetical protein
VVVSTIEHSNVEGCPGGFAVRATGTGSNAEGKVGRAGGFAGNIEGGHIQDSHCKNFSYIIGEVAAGGYVGEIKPGSVAKLLGSTTVDANGNYTDNTNILSKLLGVADISNNLLTLIQSFVPTIRNSTTTCIPCGGAVRAHSPSDNAVQRGMAGGYCGHNEGAQIWGNNTATWEAENDGDGRIFSTERTGNYIGPQSPCKAVRIRSVYGYEYAGGFTGYMECASTAETGNISLLGGLIQANSALSALKATYPTEENTTIYGPLLDLDISTWNTWVKYVGKYGGYGKSLASAGTVSTQAELEEKLADYAYGYHVVAGRTTHVNNLITEGGDAGGYVGLMRSGVIVRILVLPNRVAEAKLILKYLFDKYGDSVYISIMSQYTPMKDMKPPLDRRITHAEYREVVEYAEKIGITNAFTQEWGTADESFIPSFDSNPLGV